MCSLSGVVFSSSFSGLLPHASPSVAPGVQSSLVVVGVLCLRVLVLLQRICWGGLSASGAGSGYSSSLGEGDQDVDARVWNLSICCNSVLVLFQRQGIWILPNPHCCVCLRRFLVFLQIPFVRLFLLWLGFKWLRVNYSNVEGYLVGNIMEFPDVASVLSTQSGLLELLSQFPLNHSSLNQFVQDVFPTQPDFFGLIMCSFSIDVTVFLIVCCPHFTVSLSLVVNERFQGEIVLTPKWQVVCLHTSKNFEKLSSSYFL